MLPTRGSDVNPAMLHRGGNRGSFIVLVWLSLSEVLCFAYLKTPFTLGSCRLSVFSAMWSESIWHPQMVCQCVLSHEDSETPGRWTTLGHPVDNPELSPQCFEVVFDHLADLLGLVELIGSVKLVATM